MREGGGGWASEQVSHRTYNLVQHNRTNYQGFPHAPPVEALHDARDENS